MSSRAQVIDQHALTGALSNGLLNKKINTHLPHTHFLASGSPHGNPVEVAPTAAKAVLDLLTHLKQVPETEVLSIFIVT